MSIHRCASTHRYRDGRVTTFTSLNTCVCVQCDEVFASVYAFDKHLKRPRGREVEAAIHDCSRMPLNAKGHRVTKPRRVTQVSGRGKEGSRNARVGSSATRPYREGFSPQPCPP